MVNIFNYNVYRGPFSKHVVGVARVDGVGASVWGGGDRRGRKTESGLSW